MLELDNSLRRQSYNLPSLLEEQFEDLKEQIKHLYDTEEIREVDRIILTGCGDSYGARTLGITKQRDSDVGQRAQKIITLHISPFERGPGNRNYFVSLLALLMLGIHIGEQRGNHTEVVSKGYYEEIIAQGHALHACLPKMDEVLEKLAKTWYKYTNFDFVGVGMDYGSAWFGHAKIIEASGAFATHINAEEWFHMNNFFKDRENCGTIFVASEKSEGISRIREAIGYSQRIGRPTLVITDGKEEDFSVEGVTYIKVPTATFAPAMALTQYVPICLLAGYMGAILGERNCRGCLGAWEFAAGGKYINNSELVQFGGEV